MTSREQKAISKVISQRVTNGETIEKAVMDFYKNVRFAASAEEAQLILKKEKQKYAPFEHKVLEFEVNGTFVTVMSYSLLSEKYLYVINKETKKPMSLNEYYKKQGQSSPQRELRERIAAACGVAEMTVYRWLSGEIIPEKLKREKIAEITGLPVDQLFPNLQDGSDRV